MPNPTIHGHPLGSSAATRAVIENARKTARSKKMVLDMACFALEEDGRCHACIGGSAVIHDMNAPRKSSEWTEDQQEVAEFFDLIRCGLFNALWRDYHYYVPEEVRIEWSEDMMHYNPKNPKPFWRAWERFADAQERYENRNQAPREEPGEAGEK